MSNTDHDISIREYTKKMIQEYDKIRGKNLSDGNDLYYDAVVISTSDDEQTKAYASQIRDKVERRELPSDLPIHIYADPPGVKLGSGGSIIYSLSHLHVNFGDALFGQRILFICGGGQSQRLPTASILGKLFQPLPFGQPAYHMLDLKLAMYRPFAKNMAPGVVVTCSDDIETYFLSSDAVDGGRVSFNKAGFVALGHVSSISIGLHHGVYVLPKDTFGIDSISEVSVNCLQVLQKPTEIQMKDAGAILSDGNVCTDSVFYFDHSVTAKFVTRWPASATPTCEIDAYGDFLKPLGERNTAPTDNGCADSELAASRIALYEMLRGTPLHVVLLRRSHFFHLGTMTEFVKHLTANHQSPALFDHLGCQSVVSSRVTCDLNPNATVIHSVLDAPVHLGPSAVVECCHLATTSPLTVGACSILSHCVVTGEVAPLPGDVCFHTSAVFIGGEVSYVTTAFGIRDDLKARGRSLLYLGVALETVCSLLAMPIKDVFGTDEAEPSLWNAHIFAAATTPDEAFRRTSDRVRAVLNGMELRLDGLGRLMSVAQVVKDKHVDTMLRWRREIRKKIEK